MKMKKKIAILLTLIMTITVFSGCSKSNETSKTSGESVESPSKDQETTLPENILNETETAVTYKNPLGDEVTITKNPKKVVVLMNSILDIWYLAGGEAIGRVSGSVNVPEAANDIEQVGKVNEPSIEKILALEPDLVILSSTRSQHVEMKDILSSNNIECAYVDISSDPYSKFNETLKLFTMITEREDIYNTEIKKIQEEVTDICDKTKNEEQPKILILFGSSKYVKAELPCGLVGNMVEMLGANNIITGSPVEGSSKVTFSLEKIIQEDPDKIFIIPMGEIEQVKARIKEDLESNEAWATLTAVKENNIHYLPKDLFHYKPNARYPEAFMHLAKILYPQVFEK
ncbi:MAG: ABC transporter substrate-binding protein [Vallitalea sp.]|nr:ABC transporter substrate-binding protein [Vallitalea sp.]